MIRFGACAMAFTATLGALPLVASSVNDTHANESWTAIAADFTQSRDFGSLDLASAPLMALHSPTAAVTASVRDAAVTSDIERLDTGLLNAANTAASERQCLAEAIYYEARSETLAGQKAVGEVVMNRVGSKHFPGTVCGVVYQGAERVTGCQFSFTCDGSLDKTPKGKSWTRSEMLAEHLMIGAHKPMTARSTHYHTVDINPAWAPNLKSTRQIGSHKFYRFKSRRELAASRVAVAP